MVGPSLRFWLSFAIVVGSFYSAPAVSMQADQGQKENVLICSYGKWGELAYGTIGDAYITVVTTPLSRDEVTKQFEEYARNTPWPRSAHCSLQDSVEAAEAKVAENISFFYNTRYHRIEWSPKGAMEVGSKRSKKTVLFRTPRQDEGRGFQGATFDIEYQLIACGGELHLAYSLVKDSVRGKKPAYLFQSTQEGSPSWHEVASPPPQVDAVHLKGAVYIPPYDENPVGRYSDAFAGQSLGFGCFTGQTKKIANLKDHLGENPSKEKVQAFIDKLAVSFHTNDALTSQAAEAEIREGKARITSAPQEAQSEADAGPTAAELRAQRHAEVEARNAAAQKKYQEELAKQQQAVADFKAAEERVAAEKAAQAARAKAVQEEYQRQQAAHAAEVERHRQQQAKYEAQLAAPASVKKPQ